MYPRPCMSVEVVNVGSRKCFPFSPRTVHHTLTTMCCASRPVLLQPCEVNITKHPVATDAQTPSMNPGQFTPAAAEAVCLTHVMYYNVDHHPDPLKDLLCEVGHHPTPPLKLLLLLSPSYNVCPIHHQNILLTHHHYTPLKSLQ